MDESKVAPITVNPQTKSKHQLFKHFLIKVLKNSSKSAKAILFEILRNSKV